MSKALFKAHVEGRLKTDVMRDPERYVEFDNELPLTLLDQREAGKTSLICEAHLLSKSKAALTRSSTSARPATTLLLPSKSGWVCVRVGVMQ